MSQSTIDKALVQARRRLNAAYFLSVLRWTMSFALVAGCLSVLADKASLVRWPTSYIVLAAAGGGLAAALLVVALRRRNEFDAAMEIDRAFALKERLSTLIALDEPTRMGPAGAALAADVHARIDALDIGEKIRVTPPRFGWAPIVPLAGLLALANFVGPINLSRNAAASTTPDAQQRKVIEEETKLLAKKLADRKKEITDSSLDKELEDLTAKIEEAGKQLEKDKKVGTKEAALKLSDLSKMIEERRQKLDAVDAMKNALSKLPSMKDGPGNELAKALKDGDFKQAAKALDQLQKQMQGNKLDQAQKEKLKQQLDAMQKQLKEMADLDKRADQLRKSLPKEALKQELAKLAKDAERMKQLKQLAEKLGQCSKCMGQNEGQNGASQAQMAKDLDKALAEAQKMLDEMQKDDAMRQALGEMLNDLAECRNGMCQGEGEGNRDKKGQQDFARGGGVGEGKREIAEDKTASRETRSRSQVNKGQAYVSGQTEGRSFKGDSQLEIRNAAATASRAADEAITRQKVPKDYQKHTQEFFEKLNGQVNK